MSKGGLTKAEPISFRFLKIYTKMQPFVLKIVHMTTEIVRPLFIK